MTLKIFGSERRNEPSKRHESNLPARRQPMSQYLEINDTEAQHLAWIHSNKFTIPEPFPKEVLSPRHLPKHLLRPQQIRQKRVPAF